MGERHRAREFALQMLFQIDIGQSAIEATLEAFWIDHTARRITRDYSERLVRGTILHQGEIDRLIVDSTENWRVERMAGVDRNILRLAIYEFLFERETPPIVAIDEAIEIAKRYGGEDSGHFINGILDAVRVKLETVSPPPG